MTQKRMKMIEQEYAKALVKHPVFAHRVDAWYPPQCGTMLILARSSLKNTIEKNNVAASTVFECEYREFQDAYSKGDYDAALEELAQCGAVILRMMEMVEREKNAKVKRNMKGRDK